MTGGIAANLLDIAAVWGVPSVRVWWLRVGLHRHWKRLVHGDEWFETNCVHVLEFISLRKTSRGNPPALAFFGSVH